MTDIAQLEKGLLAAIASSRDEAALEAVRIAALGKNGSISALLKTLGTMTPDERKAQGPAINGLKDRVSAAITAAKDALAATALGARLNTETVDVTLPVREAPTETGRVHPISQVPMNSQRSSPTWASPSPKDLISRPTITTSPN